ncbi:MAG: endolytic transglycosylase MltG [Deltaproteobacteria bacterium]|nr:endolytic transglycosylase MltG [Deltaproteobacteria bacterium]
MKRWRQMAAGGAAVTALATLLLWRGCAYLDRPAGGSAVTSLRVERGATLKPLLDRLAADGVLERPRWLYWYARLLGVRDIRAGEYEVAASQTPRQILGMLREGRIRLESLVIPEGFNRWQVRELFAREGWLEPAAFDRLCDSGAFLSEHGIPGPTCEGYLFPETYRFARGAAAQDLFAALFAKYRQVYAQTTARGRGPLDLGERELVTLASIIEKETGAPDERPRIACLFYNRLRAQPAWRLETDPTVIYAATLADSNFDGNLKRSHLRELNSPYNTYRVFGLPPGPIANPGLAALRSVVEPAECRDFFFVSMNNGRHEFCPDLACHNRAVAKWQINYFKRR